jgi:hypothetical protein
MIMINKCSKRGAVQEEGSGSGNHVGADSGSETLRNSTYSAKMACPKALVHTSYSGLERYQTKS